MDTTLLYHHTEDDIAFFAQHRWIDNADVRRRMVLERAVIRRACTDLIAAGFVLRVNDGEAWACERTTDVPTIMRCIQSTDDDRIHVYQPTRTGGSHVGWMWCVYGNDGYDVIADNTVNLEPYLKGATELSDQMADAIHAG